MAEKRPERVFVLYKKSAYQLLVKERKNGRIKALLDREDPSVDRMMSAHADHQATLASAKDLLRRMGIKAAFRYRSDVRTIEGSDMVITLGGDGTLLMASHLVGPGIPMLGINTAPRDSVGFFCAGTKDNLEETFVDAFAGRLKPTELARMMVTVDGEVLTQRVLNDILFCHACPAATSRYLIGETGDMEDQKSSGVWVGPAAGSTAAQRSAGGRMLPVGSKRLQYVVREPYVPRGRGYRSTKGLIEPGRTLTVVSKMRNARIFVDGPRRTHDVDIGASIDLTMSDEPVSILGLKPR